MKQFNLVVFLFIILSGTVSCKTKTKSVDRCGDGFVDPGEECDGEVGTHTCASLGHYDHTGILRCGSDCKFDRSECGGRCGDGIVQEEHQEFCDGNNLHGSSCQLLGFTGGTLACSVACEYDTSGCTGRCGNGVLDDGEVCDGVQHDGVTCQNLGFYGGQLACATDCQSFNTDNCASVGRCGDGFIQGMFSEICDGSNLDNQTCISRGYYGGDLACSQDCLSFEESGCAAVGRCGDGLVQDVHGEVCDGANLAGQSCTELGYHGGDLACASDCRSLDLTGCVAAGQCGDGIVQTLWGEECDGVNMNDMTCATVVPELPYGLLRCSEGCLFDTSQCRDTFLVTLVLVPGGSFQRDMGPENISHVSAFWMGNTEVTREQFETVFGVDPSYTPWSGGKQDPVQKINFYHAMAFCNKLSIAEGRAQVYAVDGVDFTTLAFSAIPLEVSDDWSAATVNWDANGYRLPTEMEFMWAAMGADSQNPGSVNVTGWQKAFAGSDGTNPIWDYAVYGYDTSEEGRTPTERTNPVASKQPNELGLYDLSGNVDEWVWDLWADQWPVGELTDYRGPEPQEVSNPLLRNIRGGNFSFSSEQCAIRHRKFFSDYEGVWSIGFRVVRRAP